ncbi:MAG: DUF4349 domain-containing protein [Myxococcales bacterium]|nr:DUF4349 domain-containing protein [Myxococcales bacterium]
MTLALLAAAALGLGSGCAAGGRYAPSAPKEMRADSAAGASDYGGAEMEAAPAPPGMAGQPGRPPMQPSPLAPPKPGQPTPGAPGPGGGQDAKQIDPEAAKRTDLAAMLIYTADFRMQVERSEFAAKIDAVTALAESLGGFLSNHSDTDVTIRVPSARFRDALREIDKLGTVTTRHVEADDVTEEFNDLEVKLKSLRATRDRFEELLKQAKNITEVLQVEQELTRLNQQIDQIEGRMRFLSSRAALSTITVHLDPKPNSIIVGDPAHPPPPAPPRTITLPIEWLPQVGLEHLLELGGYRN